jgi:hypothetical protein
MKGIRMATVTRTGLKRPVTGKPVARAAVKPAIKPAAPLPQRRGASSSNAEGRTLNLSPSEPIKRLEELNWAIYGDIGIGKTSLASMFPGAYFLMFEPGGRGLELRKSECYSWQQFKADVRLLAKERSVKTVVIDVTDTCYDKCFDYVCKRENMTHPNDKTWGEGWKAIRREFVSELELLSGSGKALVFLSHAKDREIRTRTGFVYNRIAPSMSAQPWDYVGGFVDIVGFYGYYGDGRYLTIRGSDELEAKCRIKRHFRTADGKRKVHSIPMFREDAEDFDEEDAYKAIVEAFNNRQKTTGEPEDSVRLAKSVPKKTERRRGV